MNTQTEAECALEIHRMTSFTIEKLVANYFGSEGNHCCLKEHHRDREI